MNNSMSANFKATLEIIKKKPWTLFGLILLGNLLVALALILGIIPIVSLPIAWTLGVSLCSLCLKYIRGGQVGSKDLFSGFGKFKHVACGMAWTSLWIALWIIVPVFVFAILSKGFIQLLGGSLGYSYFGSYGMYGSLQNAVTNARIAYAGFVVLCVIFTIAFITCVVFAVIKGIQYSFTPYILMDKPDVQCMDAIKISKEMTKGIRGGIFGAIALPFLIVIVIGLFLSLLAEIPYVGILFAIADSLFTLIAIVFIVIYTNLVMASYYNNAAAGVPAPGLIPIGYYNQMPANGNPNGYNGYNAFPNQAPNGNNATVPNAGSTNPAPNSYAGQQNN